LIDCINIKKKNDLVAEILIRFDFKDNLCGYVTKVKGGYDVEVLYTTRHFKEGTTRQFMKEYINLKYQAIVLNYNNNL